MYVASMLTSGDNILRKNEKKERKITFFRTLFKALEKYVTIRIEGNDKGNQN